MKNKKNIYIIISILVLLLSVVGATYAYFSGSTSINANLNVSSNIAGQSYSFSTSSEESIDLDVISSSMDQAFQGNIADSDYANLYVNIIGTSTNEKVNCTYDMVFIWDSEAKYTTSDKTLSTSEFEFSMKETRQNKLEEKDLSNFTLSNNKIVLFSDSISSYSSSVTTKKKYTITGTIYNLDVEQTLIKGNEYQGHLTVENVSCTITGLDTIDALTLSTDTIDVSNNTSLVATLPQSVTSVSDVVIDGVTIESSNYSTTGTPLALTLNASYIGGLSNAEHTISVITDQGISSSTFTTSGNYAITATLEDAIADDENPEYIHAGQTVVLKYYFDTTSFSAPSSSPEVTGATASYTSNEKDMATLTLTNPTGDVSFTISGVGMCLAEGTKITMADGTIKNIENINVDDLVLTFDHENSRYIAQKVFIAYEGNDKIAPFTLNFDDGTTLSITGMHDLFEKESMNYVTIERSKADTFIGKHFYNSSKGKFVKLVSIDYETTKKRYYSLYTEYNYNVIANGMLTVPDDVDYFLKMYTYNNDLSVNKDVLNSDIEKYGYFDYKEGSFYSRDFYETRNMKYLKIVIGKNLVTYEDLYGMYYQ